MRTPTDTKQIGEKDSFATAANAAEVASIQLEMSAIQREHGALTGAGRRDDERTASTA